MAQKRKGETMGRQVDRLVRELDLETASDADVSDLAARMVAMGQGAVENLARGVFRPGPARREKVAALLACLRGEQATWALGMLHGTVAARSLGPMERAWLFTLARRLEDAAAGQAGQAPANDVDEEFDDDPLLADETQLLLWRDELASLTQGEQEAALEPILHSGDERLLPLLEMALSLRHPRVDFLVAGSLGRFHTPATLPLVRELLQRPDPAVRRHARAALLALQRAGVSAHDLFVAAAEDDEPVTKGFATLPDGAGHMAILVSRGTAPGRVRYAVVIIDPIEAGILRAWGESGLDEDELEDRLSDFADEAGQELLPIESNTAQAIVAAAEDFARARKHDLPADYVAWRRCIGRPERQIALPVTFGPKCAECGVPISAGDIKRGGLLAGHVALCALCAAQPRSCAVCGRSLHSLFDEFLVRRAPDGSRVQFLCLPCSRKQPGKAKG